MNIQCDPAQGINDIGKSTEIDCNKVLHVQIKVLIDGIDCKIRTAIGIGMIDLGISVSVNPCVGIPEDRGQFHIVGFVVDAH